MTSVSKRVGTLSNLPTDGTYDLLLIKFLNGFPESQLKFDIDDTPRKVTGIQKVAQLFLKILYTSKASNVLYPQQGTNFSQLTINANITSSNPVFVSDLTAEIKSAESQVRAILNNRTTDTASQLDSVTILGLDTSQESVVLYLKILTSAGVGAQIAVPFPALDLSLNGGP